MCASNDASAMAASRARAASVRPSIASSNATSCTVYGICGTRDAIHLAWTCASATRPSRAYV
jgi:hypothetical protein